MADIRINALATTAASTASDDFIAVDGSANGTRKLNAYSPTFGGNLTVNGGTVDNSPASGGPLFRTIRPANTGSAAFASIPNGALSASNVEWYSGMIGSSADYKIWAYNGSTNTFAFTSTPAGNVTLAGNLTVSGTGNSTFAGNVISKNTAILFGDGVDNSASLYATGGPVKFWANATEAARIFSNGNLFVGASPVDGGQKLQVSGTAAIAGTLTLTTAASSKVILTNTAASGVTWELNSFSDGDFFLTHAGVVNALQVSKTSGNATFAGNVTIGSSTSVVQELRTATSNASRLISAFDTNRWYINSTYSGTGTAYKLEFLTANTTALSLDTSQNATFAGNIKTAAPSGGTAATWRLGTVASVSPTSPNRTIEVEIGGTTYYIHAKTTNN